MNLSDFNVEVFVVIFFLCITMFRINDFQENFTCGLKKWFCIVLITTIVFIPIVYLFKYLDHKGIDEAYKSELLSSVPHSEEFERSLKKSYYDEDSSLERLKVAEMYLSGNGVAKNIEQSYAWYKVAGDEGKYKASLMILSEKNLNLNGSLFQNKDLVWTLNIEKGLDNFSKLVKNGNKYDLRILDNLLVLEQIKNIGPENYEKIYEIIEKISQKNNNFDVNSKLLAIAKQYFSGEIGANRENGFNIIQNMAKQNSAEAQLLLSNIYEKGTVVVRDPSKAYAWLLVANKNKYSQENYEKILAFKKDLNRKKGFLNLWIESELAEKCSEKFIKNNNISCFNKI